MLCWFLGAVLLVSAAPSVSWRCKRPAAQTTIEEEKDHALEIEEKKLQVRRAKSSHTRSHSGNSVRPTTRRRIPGRTDREVGRCDREAMKNYQDKNGLNPTGKIDALTLQKLGLGSDTAGKGAPVPAASSTGSPFSVRCNSPIRVPCLAGPCASATLNCHARISSASVSGS